MIFVEPEYSARITLGQMIQIGQITVIAVAFLFKKYFGTENTMEQTKQHASLLAAQAEVIAKISNSQNLQQMLIEKMDERVQRLEDNFFVPITRKHPQS